MKRLLTLTISFLLLISIGCSENSVEPKEYTEITVISEVTHCQNAYSNEGSIKLTISGGEEPYTIQWSNGATTKEIKNLKSGNYEVVVNDKTGRRHKESFYIDEPKDATVTDKDGNIYKTVKIGDQWWMAEDLKVTHNSNGEEIVSYIYDNDQSNLDNYGRLYQWDVVMNGNNTEKTQGIAPDGWHIPSKNEFETLFATLGGISMAGGKMKETGEDYWNSPNTGATNSSKFCGKGSGERAGAHENYNYQFQKVAGIYWTSTNGTERSAYYYVLNHDKSSVREILFHKDYGYSVRCIKDK